MKKIILILLTACLLINLTGCKGQNKIKDIDMDGLIEYMEQNLTFEDTLSELPQDTVSWRYGIETDVEARVFIGSGATSEEFGVFKASDDKSAEQIYQSMKSHIEDMSESFSMYLPKETKKLDASYLSQQGRYVIFAVSADENTGEIIENYGKAE